MSSSLLNKKRPPVFCPGCSHSRVVEEVDKALQSLDLKGEQTVIVSDIGCAGLFDTFFHTHAFHGLHGRALTYATGLKMVRPECTVIVVMGDGGLGIGGAHVLSSCRRNLDLTLLVLNNFNYGMTGGQCSATTHPAGMTASGFLNKLEMPLDICQVAEAAGAGYLERVLANSQGLSANIERAISHNGFSLVDIWGICPGRYAKLNKINFSTLRDELSQRKPFKGSVVANDRKEYASHYFQLARDVADVPQLPEIRKTCEAPLRERSEILLLGTAGQYINTAGELLCLSGMSGGLQASMKSDYPITVLRGHSVCEIVLDIESIGYSGITKPTVLLCVGQEGVDRKRGLFQRLPSESVIIAGNDIEVPDSPATLITVDFKEYGITSTQRALAALVFLSQKTSMLTIAMLKVGILCRYKDNMLEAALQILERLEKS